MAIKMKKSEPKVEVKPEVKVVEKPVEQKPAKMTPKTIKKPAEKPATSKQAGETKSPQNGPSTVQKTVSCEQFPDVIETKKSKFQKSNEIGVGTYLFMDEGGETNTVFIVVHKGKRVYAVDLTSKGDNSESIIEFTPEQLQTKEVDGCKFEVYQKV